MWLILIGVLFLVAAAALYVYMQPVGLGGLLARLRAGRGVGEVRAERNLEAEKGATMEERLESIRVGQFVAYMGSTLQVVAAITLAELQKFAGRKAGWQPSGREFKLIQLVGDRLIARMPVGEGEQERWFMMQQGPARGLTRFMAGTEGEPGPARQFAASDQLADVRFTWADNDWEMTDIGTFDFQVSGDGFLSGSGRCRHTMAKEVGGKRWFLFFDLMRGSGSDSLWIGPQLDLEVEIEDIL
jgi:hypothetical protein